MHIVTINSKGPLELVYDDSAHAEAIKMLSDLADHALESGFNHEYELSLKVVDENIPLQFHTVPEPEESGWHE